MGGKWRNMALLGMVERVGKDPAVGMRMYARKGRIRTGSVWGLACVVGYASATGEPSLSRRIVRP